jgi:K+-sensing histidine kinase KdpD
VALSATNCERAVTTERTLVLEDVATDADLAERAGYAECGVSCYLGAPVLVDGEVYSTFCFYDEGSRAEPFSDWQVTLVDLMAQWMSYDLERQRANERLARKNERLEEFAAIVSHDLRNPLNVLQGSLDLAEETGDPERFAACRRAADRMGGSSRTSSRSPGRARRSPTPRRCGSRSSSRATGRTSRPAGPHSGSRPTAPSWPTRADSDR